MQPCLSLGMGSKKRRIICSFVLISTTMQSVYIYTPCTRPVKSCRLLTGDNKPVMMFSFCSPPQYQVVSPYRQPLALALRTYIIPSACSSLPSDASSWSFARKNRIVAGVDQREGCAAGSLSWRVYLGAANREEVF